MGTLSLERTIISIWSLVETTAMEFRVPTAKKEIKLNLQFDTSPNPDPSGSLPLGQVSQSLAAEIKERKVVGDAVRITQVVRNLLSNAMKFTPQGGMWLFCSISA